MHDRQNFERVVPNPVDNSKGWLDDFAKRGVAEFRDDTS
jgi:hypothetical protein